MKLISLYIENFGKLSRWSLDLSGGLNTVCEENGWGKSTLAAFIKAMFYGLPKNAKRDLDENERKKYAPWQGGNYGGYLVFECTHGKFRVERSFGEPDVFALTDLSTGLPSSAFSEALGQELFGVDADGFERSVFFSARSLAPSGKNDTVRAKLTGVLDDVNDMGNFEKAYALLENRSKDYKKTGNRGKIGELEAEIRELKEQAREKRGLFVGQKSKEHELAAVRSELAAANAEAERVRVFAERIDEKKRREDAIRSLEAQRAAIGQAFVGEIPSAEELAQRQACLRAIALDNAELRRIGLNEAEQNELVALSAAFSSGAPEAETLENQHTLAAELRAKRTLHAESRARLDRERQEDAARLRELPSEAELREARAVLEPAAAAAPVTARTRLLPIAALLFSLFGAAALIFGVWKSVLPLIVCGGAGLIAGLVCLAIDRFAGSKPDPNAKPTNDRPVRDLLARCGKPVSENADLVAALGGLSEESERVRARMAEQEKRAAELAAEETDLRSRENDLRAFLARYGIAGSDPETGLRRLSESARDWNRLVAKQREAARAGAEKQASLSASLAEIDRFFARYPACLSEADPERRMQLLAGAVARHTALKEQIERNRAELASFIAEKGLAENPQTPLPDLAVLQADADRIKERQAALSERETALSIELDRATRETEKIPELEESIERLSDEMTDAKDRYRLLRLTCEYLKGAQEALTTRYLAGTRESFGKYLNLLAGEAAPQADVNAEFGVTVLDGGMTRQPESYSRGWRDILQFCVRLSLVDALFKDGETPFLLLDDPFTNLDEKRLVSAKELLGRLASQFQVLYLVCHTDRT